MKRRLLFVWSSAEFSTWDVARGYRTVLDKLDEWQVQDYRLYARMKYHAKALPQRRSEDFDVLSRVASENIIVEALRMRADAILIISAMGLHPDAMVLLHRARFTGPVVTLFTESPYNDKEQREFQGTFPGMLAATHERTSAKEFGWEYLPHAYDPNIHREVKTGEHEKDIDVLLIGTMWQERIKFFEQVNWKGIRLQLCGTWVAPPEPEGHKLEHAFVSGCIQNAVAPLWFGRARICLNLHRAHPTAESLNPRSYELAACRAFQLSDDRAELSEVFGSAVPTFKSPQELEEKVRYWLARPAARADAAHAAAALVQPHTFDVRAEKLLRALK